MNGERSSQLRKWLGRILKGLGILIGVFVLLVIALIAYVQLTWDRPVDRVAPKMTAPTDAQTLARGEYLYKNSNLCWTCHGSEGNRSPDEPQAGGLKFDLSNIGPGFGVIYASNITPDSETGVGAWSDGELARAIREGLGREGRVIFPLMPYQFTHGMSDEDVLAIVTYLRSLPPVRNRVPTKEYSFAAQALIAFGMFKPEPAITERVVAPAKGVTAEYGKYLAWSASGCAECHMPRDPNNGQIDETRPFAGGLFPFTERGFSVTASNLSPDAATGIGKWTEEEFVTFMRTGVRPDETVALPFMPWRWYYRWGDDDLRAVWLYLRSLKPVEHKIPPAKLTGAAANATGVARGAALFGVYCVVCHGEKGAGGWPSDVVLISRVGGKSDLALSRSIASGIPLTRMNGFGKTLTNEQIADLVAFIRSWQ